MQKILLVISLLLTSIIIIYVGIMAFRLRSGLINMLGEMSSSIIDRFIIPRDSMASSMSVAARGGSGGSSGGGQMMMGAVRSGVNSASSTVGKGVGKAALGTVGLVGGGVLVGNMLSDKEHKSVATGDGETNGQQNSVKQTSNKQQSDQNVGLRANNVSEHGDVLSSQMMSANANEKLAKKDGLAMMAASSLAETNSSAIAQKEQGPMSGKSVSEALASTKDVVGGLSDHDSTTSNSVDNSIKGVVGQSKSLGAAMSDSKSLFNGSSNNTNVDGGLFERSSQTEEHGSFRNVAQGVSMDSVMANRQNGGANNVLNNSVSDNSRSESIRNTTTSNGAGELEQSSKSISDLLMNDTDYMKHSSQDDNMSTSSSSGRMVRSSANHATRGSFGNDKAKQQTGRYRNTSTFV